MKWPSLRNPVEFDDLLGVILGYVLAFGALSTVVDGELLRYLLVSTSVVLFGWIAWAVHNVLEKRTEESIDGE